MLNKCLPKLLIATVICCLTIGCNGENSIEIGRVECQVRFSRYLGLSGIPYDVVGSKFTAKKDATEKEVESFREAVITFMGYLKVNSTLNEGCEKFE